MLCVTRSSADWTLRKVAWYCRTLAYDDRALARFQRVVLVACGTSYHAALAGRYVIERLAGLSADVDLGSEFRYRDLVLDGKTLVVALSQSGETADTLAASRQARSGRCPAGGHHQHRRQLAVTRDADGVLYTRAGLEIGVAATKTFPAPVTAVYLLAVALGRARGHSPTVDRRKRLEEPREMPDLVAATLELEQLRTGDREKCASIAGFLYLGRGVHYPIALEGALKLKELSYIHAEGYAGGEMKHGPIALLTEGFPVVALVPRDASYHRMLANIEEARARGGRVIAVCHEGDTEVARLATHTLPVPAAADLLTPLLSTIPLQFLAYHLATLRGQDVDQPRNLAESVTARHRPAPAGGLARPASYSLAGGPSRTSQSMMAWGSAPRGAVGRACLATSAFSGLKVGSGRLSRHPTPVPRAALQAGVEGAPVSLPEEAP